MEIMENTTCLDTNFLVKLFRQNNEEAAYLRAYEETTHFTTTIINIFELYYGAFLSGRPERIQEVEELENRMNILPFSPQAAKKAGEISAALQRKGTPLDFRDILIASIVLVERVSLKTYNLKHFERVPGLTLV